LEFLGAEEVLLHAKQALRSRDISDEQARDRQIDLLDLAHVEAIVLSERTSPTLGRPVKVIGVVSARSFATRRARKAR